MTVRYYARYESRPSPSREKSTCEGLRPHWTSLAYSRLANASGARTSTAQQPRPGVPVRQNHPPRDSREIALRNFPN